MRSSRLISADTHTRTRMAKRTKSKKTPGPDDSRRNNGLGLERKNRTFEAQHPQPAVQARQGGSRDGRYEAMVDGQPYVQAHPADVARFSMWKADNMPGVEETEYAWTEPAAVQAKSMDVGERVMRQEVVDEGKNDLDQWADWNQQGVSGQDPIPVQHVEEIDPYLPKSILNILKEFRYHKALEAMADRNPGGAVFYDTSAEMRKSLGDANYEKFKEGRGAASLKYFGNRWLSNFVEQALDIIRYSALPGVLTHELMGAGNVTGAMQEYENHPIKQWADEVQQKRMEVYIETISADLARFDDDPHKVAGYLAGIGEIEGLADLSALFAELATAFTPGAAGVVSALAKKFPRLANRVFKSLSLARKARFQFLKKIRNDAKFSDLNSEQLRKNVDEIQFGSTKIDVISREDRLKIFFGRLRVAAKPKNSEGALNLIIKTLAEVEDTYSGVKGVEKPGLKYTGRMYPPFADNIERFSDGRIIAQTKGHVINIAQNGEITVVDKAGKIIFKK